MPQAPETPTVETDVLIVGGGATGLTASMLLSTYGIDSVLVSKYPKTSNLPKAHVLYQKSMEVFDEVGVADTVYAKATPAENFSHVGWYAGIAGDGPDYGREIARLESWSCGFTDRAWQEASAKPPTNLPQNRLEPLLRARAETLAPGRVRFNHNFLSFTEDESGVTAVCEDRETERQYTVRARYLLACDGGRAVGPQVGVKMEGQLAVATSISVHFSADLERYLADPSLLLRTLLNPDVGIAGVLGCMGPDEWGPKSKEWVFHMGAMPGDHSLLEDAAAIDRMKKMLGLPDLPIEVHVINRWPLDGVVASHFRAGRAFILGDGAHRMPPAGGNGMNTAIQDAYNLCWKVAAVLRGQAGESLLASYEAERRPVAKKVVDTAFNMWGHQRFLTPILGFSPQNTPEQNWKNLRRIWEDGAEGDRVRREMREGLAQLLPSYNALNINFGYTYAEGALVPDGSAAAKPLQPIHIYQPSTRPGHSLPHAWVHDLHRSTALGDLLEPGGFTLIAGEDGQAWCDAVRTVAAERGLKVRAFTVGTLRGDYLDLRHEWIRDREITATGAVLVRPDRFVAWRAMALAGDPARQLAGAFDRVLGHPDPNATTTAATARRETTA